MSSAVLAERIKVIHIITTFSLGGATENTLFTVEGLQARGYDVSVLAGPSNSSEGDLFDIARSKGVRVQIVPELIRSIHPWTDLLALLALTRILRKEKVRIVHTHSSKAGILGRIAAFLARTPIIVHTIHGLPFHDFQGRTMYTLFRWAEKLCALWTDKLIAVTDTIVEKGLAAGIGHPKQFVTVRSGFDMREFSARKSSGRSLRKSLGLKPTDIVIGKIARFSVLKGHQYVLDIIPRVAASIPKVKFLFVGGGELEEHFKNVVRERGIDRFVVFAGLIPMERISEVLSIMDVVVHTSLLEGLARVLPQALAAGKPVVSYDIDGAHEVIQNGITGYLVEPKNEEELAARLITLSQDVKKRKLFGSAGSRLVREQWTIDSMVHGIDGVYRELLSPKTETT